MDFPYYFKPQIIKIYGTVVSKIKALVERLDIDISNPSTLAKDGMGPCRASDLTCLVDSEAHLWSVIIL